LSTLRTLTVPRDYRSLTVSHDIGCYKYIIVPTKVKELYTSSSKNQKSVIIIKLIIANKREPLLLFIIALKQKIIKN
jgi:hypothetical protein